MEDVILGLARAIVGEAGEELLAPLCAAARNYWERRLPEGVTAEDCGEAFSCAAAFSAAADLLAGRSGGSTVGSFRAGEISIQERAAAETAAQARSLRQTAERLMAPYAVPDDFSFQGVRG